MKSPVFIKRVVCGISGGVDSSVAALCLKRKGYEVIGVFMRNWDIKDEKGVCQADKDAEDGERTCRILGIPFVEVNFVKEYWNEVFVNLINDYESGLTPNPDILCNYKIKFNSFFDYAKQKLDANAIATGHYARIGYVDESNPLKGAKLLKAVDSFKDQTFFLSHVKQQALQQTLFPIGDLYKSQVRKIAAEAGLSHVALRPDSTGICFIGHREFQTFIDEYVEEQPGHFVDIDSGEIVGHHHGIHQWTVGQRCRISGMLQAYFVAAKIPASQTILVASGTDHPALYSRTLITSPAYWIHSVPNEIQQGKLFDCWFRFQHTKPLTAAKLECFEKGINITLEHPLRAITPGQYAVFYSGEECLGCARILEAEYSEYVNKFFLNHANSINTIQRS